MDNNTKNDLLEIAALWEEQSRNGKPYYSGTFGPKTRIFLFPINSDNPNAPSFRLCIAPRQQDERQVTGNGSRLRNDYDGEY